MSETTTEIAEVVPVELVDVRTGEALAPTVENAAIVLDAAREAKRRLDSIIEAATAVALEASRARGVKTFHVEDGIDLVVSGGPTVDYDPLTLAQLLREAGCPEDRIDAVVKAEVTYKVDRSVLRQLVGANEDYRAAADLAKRPVEKRWRAETKVRR